MTDKVGKLFREWVLTQRPAKAKVRELGPNRIRFDAQQSQAEVNFYPHTDGREICELRIVRFGEQEASFFLHFVLDDLVRAQELFVEMSDVLVANEHVRATKVLLCCTSAMTTTFMASKMNETAQTLGLDYEFSAMSVTRALGSNDDYAAILLAPQVAHLWHDMARAHPNALVFEIPGKVFGSYDALAAVRLVTHALHDERLPDRDVESLSPMRDLHNGFRILVITLFALREGSRLGYRLYDSSVGILDGMVRKPKVNFRDIEDLIETMQARNVDLGTLDAIGIAVPGVVSKGIVRLRDLDVDALDLGPHLTKRFGLPVYVDNNCNAAAVACYVSQCEHESVMFFRQELGHEAGGLGTVLGGRLVRGHLSLAGEPKFFEKRFLYEPYAGYDDARWTSEGMFMIATNVTLASVALTSPDAVYLAVDTVDDVIALRAELAREVGEDLVPEVYVVDDYVERVYMGEMALCVQKLRRK